MSKTHFEVQSVIFEKSKWSVPQAKKWLKDHGHRITFQGKSYDSTANFYRFRQLKPKKNAKFRIKSLKGGIKLVLTT